MVTLLFVASFARAESDNLKYTIQGSATEKAPLESLAPPPDIPDASALNFSLDGGKSAMEDEVVPLSIMEAALKSDKAGFLPAVLPTLPSTPYIFQPIPSMSDAALQMFRPFGKGPKARIAVSAWEFAVVDEHNKELFKTGGEGLPQNPGIWDGQSNDAFAVDPNNTYFSYFLYKSSESAEAKIPGEAARFLGLSRPNGADELIIFGNRVYKTGTALFSNEARIYLLDVARRLSLLNLNPAVSSTTAVKKQDWEIELIEPFSDETARLAGQRKATWENFVAEVFNKPVPSGKVKVVKGSSPHSQVKLTLKNFSDPSRVDMTGIAIEFPPQFESPALWVSTKDAKGTLIVEMRHDRLFRTGTAYLRDESLSVLAQTLAFVREQPKERIVLLRSYMAKPRESRKKALEGDPKLAALRSKVLFMLFARDRFLR